MARSALIESLRSQAARDAEAVWTEVRAEAQRYREGLAAALAKERARLEQDAEAEARRLQEQGVAQAGFRAREVRTAAVLALAERLRMLAGVELIRLRDTAADRLFDALARELPQRRWQRVRVNPADAAVAARHFPGAAVDADPAVSGGMAVECEDGRIRIDNTLETRLEIAWPDVLPRLVAGLEARSPSHGPAE